MTDYHKDRISIQVGLSGYSFKVETDGTVRSSGWLSADRIFTSTEMQKRYDEVDIALFTPKCALVPQQFHLAEESGRILAEVARLDESDQVEYVPVPQYASVMVIRTDGSKTRPFPELYHMLMQLSSIQDYNKILASYMDGYLYLTIAQGRTLLLCNVFEAQDFTTAEYFIFLAMKKLQLNPEMSSIYFRTQLAEEDEMSLYRYFKNVEEI